MVRETFSASPQAQAYNKKSRGKDHLPRNPWSNPLRVLPLVQIIPALGLSPRSAPQADWGMETKSLILNSHFPKKPLLPPTYSGWISSKKNNSPSAQPTWLAEAKQTKKIQQELYLHLSCTSHSAARGSDGSSAIPKLLRRILFSPSLCMAENL